MISRSYYGNFRNEQNLSILTKSMYTQLADASIAEMYENQDVVDLLCICSESILFDAFM